MERDIVRKIGIGLTAALLIAAVAAPALATPPQSDGFHKVTICHALPDSASHDYNVITVDIASSGYVKGGHYVAPGDNSKHAEGGDIIPPYDYVRKDGSPFHFDGQNYGDGQVAFDLGCGPEVDEEVEA
jgi:hypothetical protein